MELLVYNVSLDKFTDLELEEKRNDLITKIAAASTNKTVINKILKDEFGKVRNIRENIKEYTYKERDGNYVFNITPRTTKKDIYLNCIITYEPGIGNIIIPYDIKLLSNPINLSNGRFNLRMN